MNTDTINSLVGLIEHYDIDGIICTNTTIDKSSLDQRLKSLQGGLSGRPLYDKSNAVLKKVSKIMNSDKTIIGVGGVDSAESAKEKFSLGADLIQIYTGLVYEGPNLLKKILQS